tara:strand:- start:524 stop:1603 length:1080 start_codon:yes stop_codon:yes gene_type:complete
MMFEKFEKIVGRFNDLEKQLVDPNVSRDRNNFEKIAREHKELSEIVRTFHDWEKLKNKKEEAETLLNEEDSEIQELANEEILEANSKIEEIELILKKLLLPKDPNDEKNVILEVRAGTGGLEAALFAGDLYRMYIRYAELKKWSIEELSRSENNLGGIKEGVILIKGNGVYSRLRFESGTHRVQRVPVTETSGRIHTSAATVAVLPEADEVKLNIQDKDIRVDVYRSSGPGGQSVNTTDSAVRITHIETGLVVTCQDEKSQHKNRAKALKILSAHLLDLETQKQNAERSSQRKSQVGSGDRSERIRTYNFPQDRVTDHRVGQTKHGVINFIEGQIDEMVDSILSSYEAERLSEFEENNI